MQKKFNVIEVLISREDWKPNLIIIIWENEKIEILHKKNIESKLISILKKKTKWRKQTIVLYTSDLNILLPWIMGLETESKQTPKIFISKECVYNLKLEIDKNLSLTIKNAEKYLNLNQANEIYFYPGTKKKELIIPPYTKQTENKNTLEIQNLTKKLMPLFIKEEKDLKEINFMKNQEPEDLLKIQNEIKETQNYLIQRATSVQNNLNELNRTLLKILPGWHFNYSLSAIALNIFEKNFNCYEVIIEAEKEIDAKIRQAYIGGRCEVFGNAYKTTEKILYYDFKNMYGELMKKNFPTGELEEIKNPIDCEKIGFYTIKAKSEKFNIPILPHKNKEDLGEQRIVWESNIDYGIVYSNGTFEGTYYSEEINLFLKNGGQVLEVYRGFIFTGKEKPIFKDFAEKIIELRTQTNNKIWKKILVSFYGRLGMGPRETKNIIGNEEEYKTLTKEKEIVKEIWIGNFFIAEIKNNNKEKLQSKVWYAAIITSRARIKLWENLNEIQKKGGRLLYCATDSIFAAFNKKTKTEDAATKDINWDEEIEDAVFANINTYSIRTKKGFETKIAGIPKNTIEFDEFKKTFYTNWEKEYKIKMNKMSVFENEGKDFELSIKLNNYRKRVFSADRKKTNPWKKFGNEFLEDKNSQENT